MASKATSMHPRSSESPSETFRVSIRDLPSLHPRFSESPSPCLSPSSSHKPFLLSDLSHQTDSSSTVSALFLCGPPRTVPRTTSYSLFYLICLSSHYISAVTPSCHPPIHCRHNMYAAMPCLHVHACTHKTRTHPTIMELRGESSKK